MKCPYCDANTWCIDYRKEVNILTCTCISCAVTTIDIDIEQLNTDYQIYTKD